MSYEIYRYLFIGGAALSAVMLAVTIILFFALKIPHVVGDLSGANARRAIAEIRSRNEGTGDKTYRSSAVNKVRGSLTDRITTTGHLQSRASSRSAGGMRTEKIETEVLLTQAQKARSSYVGETAVLERDAYVLQEKAPASQETVVLSESPVPVQGGFGETVVLGQQSSSSFEIEFEITYVHSDIVI